MSAEPRPLRAEAALVRPRRGRHRPPPVADAARRFRLVVAYDGAGYAGWQRQGDRPTVQGVLEAALEEVTGLPAAVAGAGRTDAGVHAEGQSACFDSRTGLPPDAIRHLLAQVLPPDVRVVEAALAPPGFDPQRDAVSKLYRYALRLSRDAAPAADRLAWRLPPPLDLDAMRRAAALLLGTHDFRAFRNDPGPERREESTVRTVLRLDVESAWELVRVEAEGPGFLYMMVRNLVAVLVEVGRGRRPPGWAEELLRARDRRRLPPPAPAAGLCLVRVDYAPTASAASPGTSC